MRAVTRCKALVLLFVIQLCESFRRCITASRRRQWSFGSTIGTAQEPVKVPFDHWLEIAFPIDTFPVCPLYLEPSVHLGEYINTDKDKGCIMDDPTRTMAHPMIDFDVEKASELVLKSAQSSVFGRGKAVFAIARGSGGGKSRVEEEIRRHLLVQDKVLPVAITFNFNSMIELDSWWKTIDIKSTAYALSITARVASVLLGVEYEIAANRIHQRVSRLDVDSATSGNMLRQMIFFFVRRVNEDRAALGRSPALPVIDTFVLLLDENRKVDAFAEQDDMGGFVRTALMNAKLTGINVAIVISDLGFLPSQLRTGTDREVILLVPPPRLSPERVLKTWWKPKEGATGEPKALLLTLIALYNNMPRALEFAADFFHLPENTNRCVDRKLVSDLTAHMLDKAKNRYAPVIPSTLILKAAFFRTLLPLDASLFRAFRDSVVTNPIEDRTDKAEMVPDVSLLLLKVACAKLTTRAGTKVTLARIIEQGIDSVQGTIIGTADCQPSMGDALEEALTQVLRIRLALAIETNSDTLTLQHLCGLKLWKGYSKEITKALQSPLSLQKDLDDAQEVIKLSASAYQSNGTAFLVELAAVEVSAECPIRILRSASGDSWDVCVKAHNPDTDRPFHIFFDCKSGSEYAPGRNNTKIEQILRVKRQFIDTTTVLSSSVDHLFIYCITHEGVPEGTLSLQVGDNDVAGVAVNERDHLPHLGAIMGRDSTFELLGPFAELYRVARSSLSSRL